MQIDMAIYYFLFMAGICMFLRNDIKSYGKFAIFSKLKIEGGWVKRANFGKIKTKDRNFHARGSRDLEKSD